VESCLIFHLPFSVCHFSLREEAIPAMTNEKCQTENAKSTRLNTFPALFI
jgi:hypothetical protein